MSHVSIAQTATRNERNASRNDIFVSVSGYSQSFLSVGIEAKKSLVIASTMAAETEAVISQTIKATNRRSSQ